MRLYGGEKYWKEVNNKNMLLHPLGPFQSADHLTKLKDSVSKAV